MARTVKHERCFWCGLRAVVPGRHQPHATAPPPLSANWHTGSARVTCGGSSSIESRVHLGSIPPIQSILRKPQVNPRVRWLYSTFRRNFLPPRHGGRRPTNRQDESNPTSRGRCVRLHSPLPRRATSLRLLLPALQRQQPQQRSRREALPPHTHPTTSHYATTAAPGQNAEWWPRRIGRGGVRSGLSFHQPQLFPSHRRSIGSDSAWPWWRLPVTASAAAAF